MMDDPSWTLLEAARRLRCGELTARGLVEQCCERIQRFDGALHAWVHVDHDGALAAADALDAAAAGGERLAPLHGIPVGIKDIIDVAGMPTRAGSVLCEHHLAASDAPIVSQLRRAGAILLGKTVTTEFACFDPSPTVHPRDPSRTPGGSSSGSAVAMATRMCLLALGSQTGGSIIRPAAYCGVVGFKPSLGAWSTAGVIPVSPHLDHLGPITATAADAQYVWQAIARDMASPEPSAHSGADGPLSLVAPQGFFRSRADVDVLSIVDAAVRRLADAGAVIERVDLPASWTDVLTMHRRIMAYEAARYHERLFQHHADEYSRHVRGLIEEGLKVSASEYDQALEHRQRFIADMTGSFQSSTGVWLTPATPTPAPGRETTGDPAFNSPWSYCGFPAMTIPCGQSDAGLPVGLQLIGASGCDDQLLESAVWCENALR